MLNLSTGEFLEEFALIAGLVTVQVIYGIYAVLMSHLMSFGLSPLFMIIYGSFATSIFLFPFSISFERKKWPKNLTLKLTVQLILIAFGGVTMFQTLMLMGVKKTSPTVASAMPNLAPGLIFIIAWCFGLEKVNLRCIYSKVKVLGTIGCIIGAIVMSFLHGSSSSQKSDSVTLPSIDTTMDIDKIIGCFYLMAAVFVLSCNIVLQAQTMVDFPAPMSLCAITSLLGAVLTGIVQLIQEHRLDLDWPLVNTQSLMGIILLGGIVSGACVSFQTWAMKKKGPVLVSMFSPIGTVCSAILSVLTIGDSINLGSLLGMIIMFTGLYFVLWAKKNEGYISGDNGSTKNPDPEKPLLS